MYSITARYDTLPQRCYLPHPSNCTTILRSTVKRAVLQGSAWHKRQISLAHRLLLSLCLSSGSFASKGTDELLDFCFFCFFPVDRIPKPLLVRNYLHSVSYVWDIQDFLLYEKLHCAPDRFWEHFPSSPVRQSGIATKGRTPQAI